MKQQLSIGVILESFRRPFAEAVSLAHQVGAQGLQIYATQGEMAPENLTPALIREKKSIIMISEELPELIGMVDRLLVMKDGRISGEFFRRDNLTEAEIIRKMI